MKCWLVKFVVFGIFLNALLTALAVIPLYLIKDFGEPTVRGFDPADNTISLSIKPNTVSSNAATWGTALGAILVMAVVELAFAFFRQRNLVKRCNKQDEVAAEKIISSSSQTGEPATATPKQIWLNALFTIWLLGALLMTGCGITGTVTNLGKVLVARPRPAFLNFCKPDYTSLNSTLCNQCGKAKTEQTPNWPLCPTCPYIDGLTAVDVVCKPENTKTAKDMWMSFPSGHASYSMFSTVFLAAYLHSRMRESCLISRYLVTLNPLVIFSTLVFGIFTSFSRVADHRHHLTDIIAGGILGTVIGFIMSTVLALPLLQRAAEKRLFYCDQTSCSRGGKRCHDDPESPTGQVTVHNTESF